jgi:hypothetical protein
LHFATEGNHIERRSKKGSFRTTDEEQLGGIRTVTGWGTVAMTARDYATLLEDAADQIADISRANLQIILRRAALRLRNTGSIPLDEDVEEAVDGMAIAMGQIRNDVIGFIVREWLEKKGYLPVPTA